MDFYVCSTTYHLFVALVNIILKQEKAYLYLSTPDKNVYNIFIKYKKNIMNLKYIEGIHIRKRSNIKEKFFIESVIDIVEYKNIKKYIDKSNVIIFPWNAYSLYTPAEYIFKKAKKVELIEDGSNAYLRKEPSKLRTFLKKYIYLRNTTFYNNPKIYGIHVQFPDKYPTHINKNIKKFDLKKNINLLNLEQKKNIVQIFEADFLFNQVSKYENNIIVLTQPLSENRYMSEGEKINIYKDIIAKESKKNNVIIKKHPREVTFYNIEDTIELEGNFPSELFILADIKFNKAIGLYTSAVNTIDSQERIMIDPNFVSKLKNKRQ